MTENCKNCLFSTEKSDFILCSVKHIKKTKFNRCKDYVRDDDKLNDQYMNDRSSVIDETGHL